MRDQAAMGVNHNLVPEALAGRIQVVQVRPVPMVAGAVVPDLRMVVIMLAVPAALAL